MSKRQTEPRYVGLLMRGPEGWYWHFPDLPDFVLESDWLSNSPSYIQELEQLETYLDGLKSRGLPVPPPTTAREVMTDPAHRVPHRIFDLGDLRPHRQLLALQHSIDQQDAEEVRRYLAIFEGDRFVGELDLTPAPGLSRLQTIFGCSLGDDMYGCFPITDEHAEALRSYLDAPLELERYDYFLHAESREDNIPLD